tara:strand:- start:355 stop:801 length:447 start_codon:yes stop_codon:yes gene_type:complete
MKKHNELCNCPIGRVQNYNVQTRSSIETISKLLGDLPEADTLMFRNSNGLFAGNDPDNSFLYISQDHKEMLQGTLDGWLEHLNEPYNNRTIHFASCRTRKHFKKTLARFLMKELSGNIKALINLAIPDKLKKIYSIVADTGINIERVN